MNGYIEPIILSIGRSVAIIKEDYIQPPCLVEVGEGFHEVGRAGHERDSHGEQEEGYEYHHHVLHPLAQVFSGEVRHVLACIPYGEHAREIVMHGTHENAAENYPQVGYRPVCGTHYGSEYRSESGYVQELYYKDLPCGHGLVVHVVLHGLRRRLSRRVSPEKPVHEFSIHEISRNKQQD